MAYVIRSGSGAKEIVDVIAEVIMNEGLEEDYDDEVAKFHNAMVLADSIWQAIKVEGEFEPQPEEVVIKPFRRGDWVVHDPLGREMHGRVARINPVSGMVYVVFSCNENWHDFLQHESIPVAASTIGHTDWRPEGWNDGN